jgi:hypothetical protein
MKVVIEFYRTRATDDAHAVVGREVREAHDLADAIEIGARLSRTLDMPQRPDAMTIIGADGQTLHSGVVDPDADQGKRPW